MGVVFAEIMTVVGGEHRDTGLLFKAEQIGADAVLHLQALVLDLEEKVFFAEDLAESPRSLAGRFVPAFHQLFGDFTFEASGEGDQALRVFREKLLADARLVIEAMHTGFGSYFGEVAIALVGLGENAKMVVGVPFRRPAMVVFFADVKLAADDGLDAGLLGGFCE